MIKKITQNMFNSPHLLEKNMENIGETIAATVPKTIKKIETFLNNFASEL